ncbi:MAG TPA: glucosaminidase domain-containing protein [Chloroflexota bacterium]|nr:glucosaminidase domain-containing protein [Chloroflexota bacterium]
MACAAVVASGTVGVLSAPASRNELAPDPPADAVIDAALVSEPAARPALKPLPEPTLVVSDATSANVAAPSVPDAPLAMRRYVVEPGDSVRTIATQFGVTNETVIWENDLTDPDVLQVGQELHILPFSGLIHEVRPGDTVASVANAYDAPLADVIASNKLNDPFIIVVGQKLAVPHGYRPLPEKVVVVPSGAADTVQAPPSTSDQLAATVPTRRVFPLLGGTPQEQFIGSIAEAAVESADRTGVPASVTIAQAILESYWGSSRLAHEANNYFGIKAQTKAGSAGSIWFDVWEVIGGRNVMQSQAFRAYKSIAESFVDHGLFFVENGRYGGAMAVRDDPRAFAREINRAGYATDPAYASKLIGLMDRYNLYRYDSV